MQILELIDEIQISITKFYRLILQINSSMTKLYQTRTKIKWKSDE